MLTEREDGRQKETRNIGTIGYKEHGNKSEKKHRDGKVKGVREQKEKKHGEGDSKVQGIRKQGGKYKTKGNLVTMVKVNLGEKGLRQ